MIVSVVRLPDIPAVPVKFTVKPTCDRCGGHGFVFANDSFTAGDRDVCVLEEVRCPTCAGTRPPVWFEEQIAPPADYFDWVDKETN